MENQVKKSYTKLLGFIGLIIGILIGIHFSYLNDTCAITGRGGWNFCLSFAPIVFIIIISVISCTVGVIVGKVIEKAN